MQDGGVAFCLGLNKLEWAGWSLSELIKGKCDFLQRPGVNWSCKKKWHKL